MLKKELTLFLNTLQLRERSTDVLVVKRNAVCGPSLPFMRKDFGGRGGYLSLNKPLWKVLMLHAMYYIHLSQKHPVPFFLPTPQDILGTSKFFPVLMLTGSSTCVRFVCNPFCKPDHSCSWESMPLPLNLLSGSLHAVFLMASKLTTVAMWPYLL